MRQHSLAVGRTARYFTLGGEGQPVRDIWVGLHGYAQLAARFLRWLAPLDDGTTLVVAPEALSRFYLETRLDGHHGATIGATWLTREHREADLADHFGYLERLVSELRRDHPAAERLGVLGFSQGSVLAARWLAGTTAQPDRAILWGTPLPRDVPAEALARARGGRPVLLVAGHQDAFAPPGTIEAGAAALTDAGGVARAVRFDGGHSIPAGALLAAVGRGAA